MMRLRVANENKKHTHTHTRQQPTTNKQQQIIYIFKNEPQTSLGVFLGGQYFLL